MAVQRISHVGICVSNLERSLAFYRDALGFREVGSIEPPAEPTGRLLGIEGVKLRAVFLERDGTRIELLRFDAPGCEGDAAPRPVNQLGLTHLSFRVDDLDRTLEALERAGGRVLDQTRIDNPPYQSAAVFATDPDGTRIELIHSPGDPGRIPVT